MTALSRARGWFIAPPTEPAQRPTTRRPLTAAADRATAPATGPFAPPGAFAPPAAASAAFAPPAAAPAPAAYSPPAAAPRARAFAPPGAAPPDAAAARALVGEASTAAGPGGGVITSAAVLGRPGDVEPVAAALALALRRESRAKAASVVLVAPAEPEPAEAAGGAAAARRVAARLEAHGLDARVRGRLTWVRLDPGLPQFAAASRRVTLIAAPAVFAVAAPRTAALDEVLAEQDLLVLVTHDPDSPLARLATCGLPSVPVLPVRPLGRGPARSLARAGVRPPRVARRLVATPTEARR